MNNYERTELIENYLDGELYGNDLEKFELQIQTDKELKEDLFLQREIRKFLTSDEFDIRMKLIEIGERYQTKKKIVKKRKRVLTYTVLSLIVLAVFSSVFFFNNRLTNDELFEKHYKHYSSETLTQSAELVPNLLWEASSEEIYVNALRIYDKNQYIEAITMFNQISELSPYYNSKEYFTGLSYMELKNYNEAIKHFKAVIDSKESLITESAVWYLALCYLKTNQNQQAINQLNKLTSNDSDYKIQANEIIEEIK